MPRRCRPCPLPSFAVAFVDTVADALVAVDVATGGRPAALVALLLGADRRLVAAVELVDVPLRGYGVACDVLLGAAPHRRWRATVLVSARDGPAPGGPAGADDVRVWHDLRRRFDRSGAAVVLLDWLLVHGDVVRSMAESTRTGAPW